MLPDNDSDRRYVDLRKRMVRKVKSTNIERQVMAVIEKSFDAALAEDMVVVSRSERKRLLAQVAKVVLDGMLTNLDADQR